MSFTNRLKEFKQINPALVYCLDPEKSMNEVGIGQADKLVHGVAQIEDMFDAYLYAQETILATIEKNGIASITSEQVLEWLNQLHLRMAKTLASDYQTKAGEYVKMQLFRWNPSNDVQTILFNYLLGRFNTQKGRDKLLDLNFLESDIKNRAIELMKKNSDSKDKITAKTFVLCILEALGINKEDTLKLLALIEDANHDKTIEIPEDQRLIIDSDPVEIKPASIAFSKFVQLYHSGKLTSEQKLAVERIVKICMPPSRYVKAMNEFADDLVKAWQKCDKDDLNAVVTLAANTFYNITEIHAYFNGNGRLATCFMNVILLSLGRPSILMRYSDERQDPNSSYSQAIKSINENRDLLVQHIKNRIHETEKNGAYTNNSFLKVVNARVEACSCIREIKRQFPKHDINNTLSEMLMYLPKLMEGKKFSSDNQDEYASEVINLILVLLRDKLDQLKKQDESKSTFSVTVPEAVQRKYNKDEVEVILQKLETLTGQNGWKSYKNGSTILLNAKNDKVAEKLVKELNKTGALKAEFKRNAATKEPVVHLELINLEKLKLIKSLDIVNESKLEIKGPKSK